VWSHYLTEPLRERQTRADRGVRRAHTPDILVVQRDDGLRAASQPWLASARSGHNHVRCGNARVKQGARKALHDDPE
jgi:hypothetical protein